MDATEQIAEEYLKALNHGPVVFEPDGNVPPDFSLARSTAIEVRLLNENSFRNGNARGLDEVAIPLQKAVTNVLRRFHVVQPSPSYWLSFSFRRPIEDVRAAASALEKRLASFLNDPSPSAEFDVSDYFHVRVLLHEEPSKEQFRLATWSDFDAGGFVVSLYIENLNHCIDEKLKKIAPYREKYVDWWLLFVDGIAYGLDANEIETVLEHIKKPSEVSKIIVVSRKTRDTLLQV